MSDDLLTVREYGNAMWVGTSVLNSAYNPMADITALFKRQNDELEEVLAICGDAVDVNPFAVVEGPRPDIMGIHRSIGWHRSFRSKNYDTLKEHFRCRREHVPDRITLEWLDIMIQRYAKQDNYDDYEDEDE